jgi:steroid delta-isomerase-like uncharacterized protein
MATWDEFESVAPQIAGAGRRLIHARGDGEALLATVRDDDPPRIHPVNVGIVNGRLYVFVIGRSAKRADLETDGRYAIHTHVDPASPSEFMLRGRARPVIDPDERATAAAGWPFTIDDSFQLFELSIDAALLGERPTPDDWPPRYASWMPPESATGREEDNKAVVRRFIDEIFIAMNADAVDELLTDDFTPHTWGSTGSGRDDLKAAIERVSAGLSDVSMTIEEMIAEGDLVAVRLTASATQTGEFMKLPPSGKRYEIGEIHIFRIRDGRVTEHWHQADLLGLMRQLGALPGSPS